MEIMRRCSQSGLAHSNRAAALCGAAKKENGAPEWQLI
jgi:hypothetical protein